MIVKYLKILGAGLVFTFAGLACEMPADEPTQENNGDGDGVISGDGDGDGDGDGSVVSGDGDGDGSVVSGDGDGDGDVQEEEVIRGERGTSCDSTNDCAGGLSCIVTNNCPAGVSCANKSCQPSDFDIMGTGKQCHVIDCTTKDDCCGDLPQVLPEKCVGREVVCSQPSLLECTIAVCTEDADCEGGTCGGTCNYDSMDCMVAGDCAADECVNQVCSLSGISCPNGDECTAVQSCSTPICDCSNPEYSPTDEICTDPDCEGICGFTCAEERCVVDTSCEDDEDCPLSTPFCSGGACVACLMNEDCDEEGEIECIQGRCGPECEVDTQCSLYETCQSNACVYVGCQTDRECVLGGSSGGDADQRLSFCQIQDGIGTCVAPCEIDAQCGPTEICVEGACTYIGCETDMECKTIVGLHNQPLPSDARPWVTTAVCRDDE